MKKILGNDIVYANGLNPREETKSAVIYMLFHLFIVLHPVIMSGYHRDFFIARICSQSILCNLLPAVANY